MTITRQAVLMPGLLRRKSRDIRVFLAQNSPAGFALYGSGRMALLYGLKLIGLRPGDNVILPAYICDSAIYPFRRLDVEVRFHKILPNLEPDFDDLEELVDKKTRAVLGVNYFGFPQQLDILSAICQKHACLFIEDNAHSFLSRKGSRLLGTFGDIGIASLYKLVPAPNGGVLFVNSEELKDRNLALFSPVSMPWREGGYFFLEALRMYLKVRLNFPPRQTGGLYPRLMVGLRGGKDENRYNYKLMDAPLKMSLAVSGRMDFDEVVQRRRNYALWQQKVEAARGVRSVFRDLPGGVCPQFFPLIADESESFFARMRRERVALSRWPPLPGEVRGNRRYRVANFMAEHLFILPVHQSLGPAQLEKVVL